MKLVYSQPYSGREGPSFEKNPTLTLCGQRMPYIKAVLREITFLPLCSSVKIDGDKEYNDNSFVQFCELALMVI